MARTRLTLAMLCALALGPVLGGCIGPDRGLNGTVDDITIGTQVSLALITGYGNPTVNVYQGRVLLTGTAPSFEAKAQADQAARRVNGVRMVYNEMTVSPSADFNATASDTWISTQVRSEMLLAVDVQSSNYLVATDRGTVYLIGTARTPGELERAAQIARYVPGVRRVVSYVEVRPGIPVAAQPGPPAMTGPPETPMAPGPSAPIQVQKL
jgi:osmotically-inducible protein OsmY